MSRAWWLLLILGCTGDRGAETGDLCDTVDAPVTWDNFGAGFVDQNCQGCHASALTGDQRSGAPASVSFDTEDEALGQAGAILAVATGSDPSMPPGGGVSEDDRHLLEVWLSCAL